MKKNLYGFTLVELIVVITILVILGTIAFTSLSGYSGSARDSSRISDISNLRKSLELTHMKTGIYPMPTNSTGVTFSGGTVWTQGSIGNSVMNVLSSAGFKFSKKPTDPKYTNIEYTYSVLNTGKEYQIGTAMESKTTAYRSMPLFITPAYAAETLTAYVGGNYNGLIAEVKIGTMTYYLALPSIILQNLSSTELTVSSTQSGNLVIQSAGNIPSTYTNGEITSTTPSITFSALGTSNQVTNGSGIVVYSTTGSLDPAGVSILMNNLYTVYTASNLNGGSTLLSEVASLIAGGSGTTTLTELYNGSISKTLGETTIASSTTSSFTCGTSTISDADGNSYNTVLVGTQCWMASNMYRGTMLASGGVLPSNNAVVEKWCFNNDCSDASTYGAYYTWAEAMGLDKSCNISNTGACNPSGKVQGICSTGWHIPQDSELTTLIESQGGAGCEGSINGQYYCPTPGGTTNPAGSMLAGGVSWNPATDGLWRDSSDVQRAEFNASGFGIEPSSIRDIDGSYASERAWDAHLMSSTTASPSEEQVQVFYSWMPGIYRLAINKSYGISVRCIKD